MNIKHLSPLFVASAITLGVAPAFGEASSDPGVKFSCQINNEGVPTTVAIQSNGDVQPVFHWNNSDVLKKQANPQQLCNSVSNKLENYPEATFKPFDQAGVPAICVSSSENTCDSVLFTLEPTDNPLSTADRVLAAILDEDLQGNPTTTVDRGLQSTSYKVDFWTLFGLKLFK
jgi:hypothetical protein